MTVPIFALNQVSEERGEWLVPGMLKDKVLALLKSLHQKPRARLVPLPEFAESFVNTAEFAQGGLMDVLLKAVRDKTQLDVKRVDFKLDMLSPHLFMNYRVVDEHGRQLGMGRNLPALKAELGALARGAFQALAALKAQEVVGGGEAVAEAGARSGGAPGASRQASAQMGPMGPMGQGGQAGQAGKVGPGAQRVQALAPAAKGRGEPAGEPAHAASTPLTDWTFGELPELMEIQRGGHTLIGFPALIDKGTHVEIDIFDEPDVAALKHRAGLRRLVALQIREPLKYLEKNIPDLQKMAMVFMPLGTADELREFLKGNLAAYKIPSKVWFRTEPIPRNASGKFLKREVRKEILEGA